MGAAKVAAPRLLGAGEGPAGGPEELGGGESRGQSAHVEREEKPVAPAARAVERRGHQLLAGPRLPAEEHRHVEIGDLRDLAADVEQGVALSHHAVAVEVAEKDRAKAVEQEDHRAGEEQDHAALDLVGRERGLVLDRRALGGERHGRVAAPQPDPACGRGLKPPGPAADMRHGEGPESRFARLRERRLPARQPLFPSRGELEESRALSHPLQLRVAEDRQAGHGERTGRRSFRRRPCLCFQAVLAVGPHPAHSWLQLLRG